MPPCSVAIVDYGSGNLRSAEKAFQKAAEAQSPRPAVRVTSRPEEVLAAERIVLPGVGAFADCMAGLRALAGMPEALDEAVRRRGRPFLGICVGMQLLAERGLEDGRHAGLGWIEGEVRRLTPADPACKVPHMGWNRLHHRRAHPLFAGLADGTYVYFVHSYHLVPGEPGLAVAQTEHGQTILAALAAGNMAGTQFHPEKSQAAGLRLIANFLGWRP
ncbi:MAG: imidazole glycerol phosphate synthase subunit HisH [Alphaproteobacteria bacterium]|nr:imidazole glycerol phosphate synthase subunit HisH [Alphaproteobacteria bacterium]